MVHAGLDLGTTYSALCIYDSSKKNVDYFKFDGCALEFFPTIIAYRKNNDNVRYIGQAARRFSFSPDYDVYDNFKLALGTSADDSGDRIKTPRQVTQDFIEEVLKKFEENQGQPINVLVQTVPDTWKNEPHHFTATDHLTEIYRALGMYVDEEQVSFESEPVSAAAFYLNEICQGDYEGAIMVIDYGGGTLDLTLCRAEANGSISVLYSCGNSGENAQGCAGNAFDRAVVQRLIDRYKLQPNVYEPDGRPFKSLCGAFEDAKIASTGPTRIALEDYYASNGFNDQEAFSVILPPTYEQYSVLASDIAKAFHEVNQQALEEAVQAMQQHCEAVDIDIKDINHFRVLLVGGFSNLYCVESCVRTLFGSVAGINDVRFDERLNRQSRSTAIAHGASLIAADVTPVEYVSPYEIGYRAVSATSGELKNFSLIQRGQPVKEYVEPRFLAGKILIRDDRIKAALPLYFDYGRGPVNVSMDEGFLSLCPNPQMKDNEYRIGASIDRHRIPQLHIRDKTGEENVVSLLKILERIVIQFVEDEQEEST